MWFGDTEKLNQWRFGWGKINDSRWFIVHY
jgi:hypothetical protein